MVCTMLLSFICYLTICATSVSAIPTITAVGSKFFTSDGNQFFLRGIAYQLKADDPLVDTEQCQRDVALMRELGANAIRVYHVDPLVDHTGCMKLFADAGIYLFVDLDTFHTYIRLDVAAWNQNKSDSFEQVMDEFQKYENTGGFFVVADSEAAPYLLAATADMKSYRDTRGYRPIPIGYSATDAGSLRPMLQDYVVCRPNASERMDFFGLNAYEWCGSQLSFELSGYLELQKMFEGYPAPLFFSETGCNTAPPRTFGDQSAIFGPNMSETWSGAIIYEWIQEANNYGLVSYGPVASDAPHQGTSVVDGFTRQGIPTPVQPDFSNLKAQWATLTPTGVALSAYSGASVTPRPCPSSTAGGWAVDPNSPLPTIGQTAIQPDDGAASATGNLTAVQTADSGTASATGQSATSTPAQGNAVQSTPNILAFDDGSLAGCVAALLTVGLAMVLLL